MCSKKLNIVEPLAYSKITINFAAHKTKILKCRLDICFANHLASSDDFNDCTIIH